MKYTARLPQREGTGGLLSFGHFFDVFQQLLDLLFGGVLVAGLHGLPDAVLDMSIQ